MSYRIEYGPAIPAQYLKKRSPFRLQIMTAVCFLLFSFSVRLFFPAGIQKLRSVLLPPEHSITQEALDAFMGDLREGLSLSDSFTAFCVYIIDHDEALSG